MPPGGWFKENIIVGMILRAAAAGEVIQPKNSNDSSGSKNGYGGRSTGTSQ